MRCFVFIRITDKHVITSCLIKPVRYLPTDLFRVLYNEMAEAGLKSQLLHPHQHTEMTPDCVVVCASS